MSNNEIGCRLKTTRIAAGLTQADAAGILGVSFQTISRYERGVNSINSGALLKLCAAYGLTVSELIGGTDKKTDSAEELTTAELELIDSFRELNDEGREKLLSYADDLVESGKYRPVVKKRKRRLIAAQLPEIKSRP